MIYRITRAFFVFFLVISLLLPATQVSAQGTNLLSSAPPKGLTFELELTPETADLSGHTMLTTVQFGNNQPLHISEKKGLESETFSDPVISNITMTPSPVISPRDPLVATASSVVITEPVTKLIFDAFPTPTPTATLVPTRIPTKAPVATPQSSAAAASAPVNMPLSNGGLNADKLFDMSNAHRASKGLPPFQKDARACELAVARAPEIAAEVANGNMHAGMYGRNLPYWNTENIISMASEESAFNWWINDGIHREAIEGNYTYSCVACQGNNCAQEFTNFQPK